MHVQILCGFLYLAYQRVFTDANVREPGTVIKIGQAIEKAYEEARRADISLHPSVELAMELREDGRWCYYFADHDRPLIFWFEDHESRLMKPVRCVERKSHLSASPWNNYFLIASVASQCMH